MTDPPGGAKTRLIEAKERRAAERTGAPRREGEDRLPPGQYRVEKWPVLDLGVRPEISAADWRLEVDGAVERPRSWSWAEFTALPQVEIVSDIHCVTAWSRFDNRWTGVAAAALLAAVEPRPEARHVQFESHDGYTTNLPLAAFANEDVLLARGWDGAPLTAEHGGPVRVVVPKRYFWKSAKWVRRITLSAGDRPGFWEVRGYHNEGCPWREERYG